MVNYALSKGDSPMLLLGDNLYLLPMHQDPVDAYDGVNFAKGSYQDHVSEVVRNLQKQCEQQGIKRKNAQVSEQQVHPWRFFMDRQRKAQKRWGESASQGARLPFNLDINPWQASSASADRRSRAAL